MNRYHHTHTHTHTHGKDGIKFFTGELEGHARVTRLETAKNSVDARCMRSHTSACRRAPARPCRCPTTHVPLARRSHTHTQCPPMSMPHHPRASRRAPPPVSHTQCLPHGDPQPHVLLAARPRPSHIRSAYPPRSTTASRHTPPPEQNPRHSRPCAPTHTAERRQHRAHRHEWHDTARQKREHRTRWYRKEARVARHRTAKTRASHALVSKGSTSGTTPHGKNESIARAGIKSKPNTRHHQIRLWLHVRPAQRTGCARRRHRRRRVRSRGLFGRKVGGGDVAWSVRDGVTLLGPLRTVYRSRRYGVT